MRYSFAILALAGASVAMPTRIARDNVQVVNDVVVDTKVDVVTDYVTVVGPSPTPAAQAPAAAHNQKVQPAAPAAPVVTVVTVAPAPAPAAPSPAPAAASPAQPKPQQEQQPAASSPSASSGSGSGSSSSSGSNPNDGSPMSGSMSMLQIANKYRSLYNLPTFTWSSQLQANAQKTDNDDHGSEETHELNTGSLAQVITPGNNNKDLMGLQPFEVGYVGGWLCEEPVSQLNGICPQLDQQAGLDVSGETGHAQILRNPQYSKIGCAWTSNNNGNEWGGLWICDLA